MLIRRNTEGIHSFSEKVDKELNIFDMQGLLLDTNGIFTAAIEAFEYPNGAKITSVSREAFGTMEELYIRSCFAQAVNVPFYILLHKQQTTKVTFYEVFPDIEKQLPACDNYFSLTEDEFIQWWRNNKQTEQVKQYRNMFTKRIKTSYYDCVLESNGLKWGGNIDGYFVDIHTNERKIWGIIEKRYTNKTPIDKYDPADYFKCGGGDYNTWKPLFLLKQQIYGGKENIPIFLFIYSNRDGEKRKVGVTIIDSLSYTGIEYIKDEFGQQIKPNHIICDSIQGLKEKIKYLLKLYSDRNR